MNSMPAPATRSPAHQGPPLGILAVVGCALFIGGLYAVVAFTGGPHFPGPWESGDTIAAHFQNHSQAVLICAFLQFGAAIPLGIYSATVVLSLIHISEPTRLGM